MAQVNYGVEEAAAVKTGEKNGPPAQNGTGATPTDGASKLALEKNVTMLNGIGLIVGCVIGSGIFISPTGILSEVNSVGLSLLVWLGCGLLAMFGCLCYTELGTFITKSGGEYAYLMEAFGRIPAFLFAWTSIVIIRPASGAIIALIFAEYVAKPFYPSCDAPAPVVKLLACLCLGMFVTLFLVERFISMRYGRLEYEARATQWTCFPWFPRWLSHTRDWYCNTDPPTSMSDRERHVFWTAIVDLPLHI